MRSPNGRMAKRPNALHILGPSGTSCELAFAGFRAWLNIFIIIIIIVMLLLLIYDYDFEFGFGFGFESALNEFARLSGRRFLDRQVGGPSVAQTHRLVDRHSTLLLAARTARLVGGNSLRAMIACKQTSADNNNSSSISCCRKRANEQTRQAGQRGQRERLNGLRCKTRVEPNTTREARANPLA